jgi:hypothetical protein
LESGNIQNLPFQINSTFCRDYRGYPKG